MLFVAACGEQVVVRETEATCGNERVEAGEACDDGNEDNADGCTNACEIARCGDAVHRTDLGPSDEGYENCDDGNTDDADAGIQFTRRKALRISLRQCCAERRVSRRM